MATADFTTTIVVPQSPQKVFNAINNVSGWWSEEIEGGTEKLNDEFNYHYQDVHSCKIKLAEVIPNQKVVWLVLENYFKFTKDKSEWVDTKIIFDISEKDGKTELRFTHQGLVPAYECYEICRDAWTTYIQKSLYNLITTGKGNPNGKDKPQTENEKNLTNKKKQQDYNTSITVKATASEAFEAINNVSQWWSEDLEGNTLKTGDVFTVRFGETTITSKVTELIPGKKITWHVTDCHKHWLKNKKEWKDTTMAWEILTKDNTTEVNFTHTGLVPGIECYNGCEKAWNFYIKESLFKLLTEGKGLPEAK